MVLKLKVTKELTIVGVCLSGVGDEFKVERVTVDVYQELEVNLKLKRLKLVCVYQEWETFKVESLKLKGLKLTIVDVCLSAVGDEFKVERVKVSVC